MCANVRRPDKSQLKIVHEFSPADERCFMERHKYSMAGKTWRHMNKYSSAGQKGTQKIARIAVRQSSSCCWLCARSFEMIFRPMHGSQLVVGARGQISLNTFGIHSCSSGESTNFQRTRRQNGYFALRLSAMAYVPPVMCKHRMHDPAYVKLLERALCRWKAGG